MSYQRCPVCEGRGCVPAGFYRLAGSYTTATSANPEPCRACDGRGVLAAPFTKAEPSRYRPLRKRLAD